MFELFSSKKFLGFFFIAAGILLFLVEFKAFPPGGWLSNPKKWDELHKKYYRAIKLFARVFLLWGLTLLMTANRGD